MEEQKDRDPGKPELRRAIWSAKGVSPRAAEKVIEKTVKPQPPASAPPQRSAIENLATISPRKVAPIPPWSASLRVGKDIVSVTQFRRETFSDSLNSSTSATKSPRPNPESQPQSQSIEFPSILSFTSRASMSDDPNLAQRLQMSSFGDSRWKGTRTTHGYMNRDLVSINEEKAQVIFYDGSDDEYPEGDDAEKGETLKSLKCEVSSESVVGKPKPKSLGPDPTLAASDITEGMSLVQVSSYLATHGFLHCTPRYNVEHVERPNYYDLVVLEMPGNNPSGYVWKRKFGGSKDTFVLQPHQLLQLSLDGVVCAGEKDKDGLRDVELMSLRQLLRERELITHFFELRFFSRFKEARVFYAWHVVARNRRLQANKHRVLENGLFSDPPIYSALLYIRRVTYELQDIELFHVSEPGPKSVSEYMTEQMSKLSDMQKLIRGCIESICDTVETQHSIVTGDQYLHDTLAQIKANHPFLPAEAAGLEIDWAQVRSMQRCSDKGHRKIEATLLIAQFMVHDSMATVLDRFWCHFRYLLRGVKNVERDGSWTLQSAAENPLFDIPVSGTGNQEMGDNIPHHDPKIPLRHRHQHHHHHQHHVHSGLSRSVTEEWENEGSHLTLDVSISRDLKVLTLSDMLTTTNSNKLKVKPMPLKFDFLDQFHSLCGKIGILLDSMPNLKKHRLMQVGMFTEPNIADADMENLSTVTSSKYFSTLHMLPILSSKGGLEHALESIRACQIAYSDASSMESHFKRIQEITRKLWSLEPESLAHELHRSLILTKVREILRDPETADDVKRAMTRDQGRLGEVKKTIAYLENASRTIASSFPNIKHSSGFITSFKSVTRQLQDYICAAEHKLFMKLPLVFGTRIRSFIDYLKLLENMFELKSLDFDESIQIMQKLKNFDLARDAFDLEVEVCEAIYHMIVEYNESEKSTINKARAGLVLTAAQVGSSNKGGNSLSRMGSSSTSVAVSNSLRETTLNSNFHSYSEARDRLFLAIGKARNYLLAQLSSIKTACFSRRKNLHERISAELNGVAESEKAESSAVGKLYAIEKCGKKIYQLGEDVKSMLATQALLLEAHEIIGSATPLLLPVEVDQYKDMAQLDSLFKTKSTSLSSLVDVGAMKRKCLKSKIGSSEVWVMNKALDRHIETLESQRSQRSEAATLDLLAESIEDLKPKLETVTYLSCAFLRPRHWMWLGENVLQNCDFTLKFAGSSNEIISVVDISGKEPVGMGNITRLTLNDFWDRGVDKYLDVIRRLAGEALMESIIEATLDLLDDAVRSMTVELSMEWIVDNRMREKVGYELNQVTNLTQLGVMLCYYRKTVLVLENTSGDMSITCFNDRIEKLKYLTCRLERFINNLHDIQFMWRNVFHFVKFSDPGELDRDTNRLFQLCTEEMKKIELDFQTKQLKVLPTFEALTDGDKSTNIMRNNLKIIMEDPHCSIQSLLDACPRLSLLSYSKVSLLANSWILGIEKHLSFISSCFHDMFDGVGVLAHTYSPIHKVFSCNGCSSHDDSERITFAEPIEFSLGLEIFLIEFENKLRGSIVAPADAIMLTRVQTLQSILRDIPSFQMISCVSFLFPLRIKQIIQSVIDKWPNQSIVLSNACIFAEDVWFCVGHPIGSVAIAKQDFVADAAVMSSQWRNNLHYLLSECKANINNFREILRTHNAAGLFKLNGKKCKALVSVLLQQEISFSRVIEELAAFKCLESACEHWAGRYQLHFLYDREERQKQSPFDVGLGCSTLPYGLEYHGGLVRVVPDEQLENVLDAVIGAATSMRATILINHDSHHVPWEAVGEHSVSCRDIASAFGRVFSTLVSVQDIHSVKLFLSRLVYLDAVGCIDFTSMDHAGLQILTTGLNACWGAVQSQDVSIHEWLKFPLKTKLTKTEVQHERCKSSIQVLREHLLNAKIANVYTGIIVVGMASETLYMDENVLNYATRSIFTTVAVPNSRPIEAVGLLFSAQGFTYAMEIQSVFIATIRFLSVFYGKNRTFIRYICSRQTVRLLADLAGIALFGRSLEGYRDEDVFQRLKAEFDVFAAVLWEIVLHMGDNHGIPIVNLRRDMFAHMQTRLDAVMPKGIFSSKKLILEENAGSNTLQLHPAITNLIHLSSRSLHLVSVGNFKENCARLWGLMASPHVCLVLLSGEPGCGKSSIRNTIIHAIEHSEVEYSRARTHGGARILIPMRAMMKVRDYATRWLRSARAAKANPAAHIKLNEGNHANPTSAKAAVERIHPKVYTSVIYHTSLSFSHFLGSFDKNGRWMDGILLRKFRSIDLGTESIGTGNNPSETPAVHVIVLDGPLGHYAEQVFGASHYYEMDARIPHKESINSHLVFPSGEQHTLPHNAIVLLETNDLSHASPSLVANTPHLHIATTIEVSVTRIINVWCRSISNWLGYFPPWADSLEELIYMVQTSKFIPDMLYFDYSVAEMKPMIAISRISSFLRITEELLGQIHEMAGQEATFHIPEQEIDGESDEESDEEGDDRKNAKKVNGLRDYSAQVMSLNVKAREAMKQRVVLAVCYAAVWGFGGCVNGSERRKFFDSVARDCIDRHMRVPVDLTDDCIIFDAALNLEAIRLQHSFRVDEENREFLPKMFDHVHIGAERRGERLQFVDPSMTAVKLVMDTLLSAGSHVLMMGPKGSGKTNLIRELLSNLGRNIPTPEQIKAKLVSNMLSIISKRENVESSDGMGIGVSSMHKIISKLQTSASLHDDDFNFSQAWSVIQTELQSHWADAARRDCHAKTVYSATTTLKGIVTAEEMRAWLEREFATEVDNVLESPRYTHALVIVDDMHMCAQDLSPHDRRMITNRPEALIKGLVDNCPAFGVKKNLAHVPLGVTHGGRTDGRMERDGAALPVFHRPCLSDPRQKLFQTDDYLMQSVGIVGAATGMFHQLVKSPGFCQPLKNFACVGLPLLTSEEIHVCMITGANLCLQESFLKHQVNLSHRLVDLTRFILSVNSKMISATDSTSTSDLEKALRTLIVVDVGMVSRFCHSVGLGAESVHDAGGLLQLFVHEWRRYFLDPLPTGTQRDRLIQLFSSNLDTADPREWSTTDDWMQELIESFHRSTESVWANPAVFSRQLGNYKKDGWSSLYVPMELNHLIVESGRPLAICEITHTHTNDQSTLTDSLMTNTEETGRYHDIESTAQDRIIDVNELASDLLPQSILYPAACSLLLKLIRVLSSIKRNILLSGFHGTTKTTAVTLAGKVCGFKIRSFDVKESMGVVDVNPSDRALAAVNFKRFLKSVIWQASGFSKVAKEDDMRQTAAASNEYFYTVATSFEVVEPEKVLLVINGSQQLTANDRRLLVKVLDYFDPCCLFDNSELLKMFNALREDLSKTLGQRGNAGDEEIQQEQNQTKDDDDTASSANEASNVEDALAAELAKSKLDAFNDISRRYSAALSGYGYQWVRRRLQTAIYDYISVVLDSDMPRAMELHCDTTQAEESAINSSGRKRAVPAQRMDSLHESKDMQVRIEENLQSKVHRKRFSLLSGTDSLNGNSDGGLQEVDDEDLPKGDTAELPLPCIFAPPSTHGIFSCPILGPMLSSRFSTIWYDVEGYDAVRGVCHAVMKPAHELHTSLTDTNEIVLSFESVDIGDPSYIEIKAENAEKALSRPASQDIAVEANDGDEDENSPIEEQMVTSESALVPRRPTMSSFQLSIHYEKKLSRLFDYLSVFTSEGIFRSFKHNDTFEHDLGHVSRQGIEEETSILIEEARSILPHLLCIPSVSDALLLSEPVIIIGPERSAEIASHLVTRIISTAVEVLLIRKNVLQTVLPTLWEGLDVVHSRAVASKTISNYINEINILVRKLSSQKQVVAADLTEVTVTAQRSTEYEAEQMVREEWLSVTCQRQTTTDVIQNSFSAKRAQLLELNTMEWQGLAAILSSSPDQEKVEIMRAVMIVVSYAPSGPNGTPRQTQRKKKKKSSVSSIKEDAAADSAVASEMGLASITMDDETVARHSVGLLRTASFPAQFTSVEPMALSKNQIASLKKVLSNISRFEDEREKALAEQWVAEGEFASLARPPGYMMENPLPKILSAYLRILLRYHELKVLLDNTASDVERLKRIGDELHSNNAETVMLRRRELQKENETITSHIHDLDATLLYNRSKIEALNRIDANRDEIENALEAASTYVDAELHQIEEILSRIVADSCIAAAVLVKTGWLPEQMRQEYMDQMRRELQKHSISVSDTPFVLGSLSDRMQIREWTNGHDNALPRDPSAINARSLVQLSPMHSFIIDQEGVCASVLSESIPKGYEQVQVSAMKFSLSQLEGWVQVAQEAQGNDAGLAIIISDAQAGLSDDLIAFLSADLYVRPKHVAHADQDDPENPAEVHTLLASSFASLNWHETIDKYDLVAQLNPMDIEYSRMMDGAHLLATQDDVQSKKTNVRSNAGDKRPWRDPGDSSHRPNHQHHDHHHMVLNLCRMRVYLVSSRAPTIDSDGQCRPVPSCCLKNMTFILWPTSTLKNSFFVESKPTDRVFSKEYVSEHFLASRSAACLANAVSPGLSHDMSTVSNGVVQLTNMMYEIENKTICALFHWTVHERQASLHALNVEGLVSHSAVPIGFLVSESRTKLITQALAERKNLNLELDALLSYERELICYRASLEDVFNMSGEFLRMCGAFLPEEILPPYALSTNIIISKCFSKAVNAAQLSNLLAGVPESLLKMDLVERGVVLLQKKIRGQPLPARGRPVQLTGSFAARNNASDDFAGASSLSSQRKRLDNRSQKSPSGSPGVTARKFLADQPGGNNSPGVTSRKSLPRRSSRSQPVREEIVFVRPMRPYGLPKARRTKSAIALNVLLQPLRQYFLDSVIKYVQSSVRPGMEWIVKLILLLTTTLQSHSRLSMDEIRALFHFIHASIDCTTLRYGLYMSYKRDEVELSTRLSLCASRKSSTQYNRRRSMAITTGMQNLLKVRRLSQEDSHKVHVTSASMAALQANVRSIRWMSRGSGWLDGLLISRGSNRWSISYIPHNSHDPLKVTATKQIHQRIRKGNDGGSIFSDDVEQFVAPDPSSLAHNPFMLDMPDAEVVSKSVYFTGGSRQRDTFEAIWLTTLGVRLFSTAGLPAALALGVPDPKKNRALQRPGPVSGAMLGAGPKQAQGLIEEGASSPSSPGKEEGNVPALASFVLGGKRSVVVARDNTSQYVMKKKRNIDLATLLLNKEARVNFYVLGAHSSLKSFQGMGEAAEDIVEELIEWKTRLNALQHVDIPSLSAQDLLRVVQCIKPPNFECESDSDEDSDEEEEWDDSGMKPCLWRKGYELTVLQSLLLSEAVEPGSCGRVAKVYFAIMASFLKMGGRLVRNWDELEPSPSSGAQSSTRKTSDTKPFQKPTEKDDSESDDDGDEFAVKSDKDGGSSSSSDDEDDGPRGVEQLASALSNSWNKLSAVISGKSADKGPQLHPSMAVSKYQLACRAFRNWEGVLLSTLQQQASREKFVFMEDLRRVVQGNTSSIFLASDLATNHMAVLSMHARDFGSIGSKLTSIVSCNPDADAASDAKHHRSHMQELQRAIKAATADSLNDNKVIVEMVDISSPTGNALLAAAMFNSKQGIKVRSLDIPGDDTRENKELRLGGAAQGSGSGQSKKALEKQPSVRLIRSDSITSVKSDQQSELSNPNHSSSNVYDRLKLQHITTMSQRYNNALNSQALPQSLFITSAWGGSHIGQGPLELLGNLDYSWLPRFFLPDVLSTQSGGLCYASHASDALGLGLPPCTEESKGILAEELEAALLWMLGAIKIIGRSSVASHLRDRITAASRMELRATACVVVIWKMAMYIRSVHREHRGDPGLWSHCLRPLSLWQLVRLLIKVSDVMSVTWQSTGANIPMAEGDQPLKPLPFDDSLFGSAEWLHSVSKKTMKQSVASDLGLLTEPQLLDNESFTRAVSLCVEPLGASVLEGFSRGSQFSGSGLKQMTRKQSLMLVRRLASVGRPGDALGTGAGSAPIRASDFNAMSIPAAATSSLQSIFPPQNSDPSLNDQVATLAPRIPSAPRRGDDKTFSPLAAYRIQRGRQNQLANAAQVLLNSMASINRLILRDDAAVGATTATASAPLVSAASNQTALASSNGDASAGSSQDKNSPRTAKTELPAVDETGELHSRMRAMAALYFAELTPQLRKKSQESGSARRVSSTAGTKRPGQASGRDGHRQSIIALPNGRSSKKLLGEQIAAERMHAVDVANEGFVLRASLSVSSDNNSNESANEQNAKTGALSAILSSREAIAEEQAKRIASWPAVNAIYHDVHLGNNLSPAEMILFMVNWTLEGKE